MDRESLFVRDARKFISFFYNKFFQDYGTSRTFVDPHRVRGMPEDQYKRACLLASVLYDNYQDEIIRKIWSKWIIVGELTEKEWNYIRKTGEIQMVEPQDLTRYD